VTLTVDDLRGFVESSLGDDALGLLLDAAYEEIDRVIGIAGYDASASVTEVLTGIAGDLLMLSRPASAVTSVLENDVTLAADDYELLGDQMLRRLNDGTNPQRCWGRRVIPTYELVDNANERDRAAIALVQLDVNRQPGVASERLGDHSITFAGGDTYTEDRAAILASLTSPGFVAK
jgi:hypothetical protein